MQTVAEILEAPVGVIEDVLRPVGLMEGDNAVLKRMVVGSIAGGLAITYIKPNLMFDARGNAREWSLFVDGNDKERLKEATMVPWYVVPFAGALFLGVFV
jgi:hypothetical protein